MKNKLGLLKRLSILAVLVLCLGFVMTGNLSPQKASTAPCCHDCAVDPFDPYAPTPQEYCQDQCGVRNGPCVDACLTDIYNCWSHCVIC